MGHSVAKENLPLGTRRELDTYCPTCSETMTSDRRGPDRPSAGFLARNSPTIRPAVMPSQATIRVRHAVPQDLAAWQGFVDPTADAGGLHHAGWYEVLED